MELGKGEVLVASGQSLELKRFIGGVAWITLLSMCIVQPFPLSNDSVIDHHPTQVMLMLRDWHR